MYLCWLKNLKNRKGYITSHVKLHQDAGHEDKAISIALRRNTLLLLKRYQKIYKKNSLTVFLVVILTNKLMTGLVEH